MSSNWTRRHFLNSSVAASLLVTSIEAATPVGSKHPSLKAVIDEIIPAGNGMPAASEVGGVAYIEKLMVHESAIGKAIEDCLATLNGNTNADAFSKLAPADRIAALSKLETDSEADFVLLRDSVYESYYTQPQIWRLIGYELFPTDHSGPHMKPFDKSAIENVSKKPRYYREA